MFSSLHQNAEFEVLIELKGIAKGKQPRPLCFSTRAGPFTILGDYRSGHRPNAGRKRALGE